MATCKECVHVDVCEDITRHKLSPERAKELLPILRNNGKICDHFKDRSRFVELPIKPGAFLFVPFRNQISKFMVIAVSFGQFGTWIDRTLISGIDCSPVLTCVEAIGKTAFLSSKEAERILKEREG